MGGTAIFAKKKFGGGRRLSEKGKISRPSDIGKPAGNRGRPGWSDRRRGGFAYGEKTGAHWGCKVDAVR